MTRRDYSANGYEWTEYDEVKYTTNEVPMSTLRMYEEAQIPYKEKFERFGKDVRARMAVAGYTDVPTPYGTYKNLVLELFQQMYPTLPDEQPWMLWNDGGYFKYLFGRYFSKGFGHVWIC